MFWSFRKLIRFLRSFFSMAAISGCVYPKTELMFAQQQKEMTLWDVVEMCQDCKTFCEERTRRVVEDAGVKVWGFGWKFDEIAKERREAEQSQCEQGCFKLQKTCPSYDAIRNAVETSSSSRAVGVDGTKLKSEEALQRQQDLRQIAPSRDGKYMMDRTHANNVARGLLGDWVKPKGEDEVLWPEPQYVNAQDHEGYGAERANKPSQLQLRRCENEADQFTRTLYSIATKPTKVVFERQDDELKTKAIAPPIAKMEEMTQHPGAKLESMTPQEVGERFTASRTGRGSMGAPMDLGQGQVTRSSTQTTASGTRINLDNAPHTATGGSQMKIGSGGDPVAKREGLKIDEQKMEEMRAWSRSAAEGMAYEEKHGLQQGGAKK